MRGILRLTAWTAVLGGVAAGGSVAVTVARWVGGGPPEEPGYWITAGLLILGVGIGSLIGLSLWTMCVKRMPAIPRSEIERILDRMGVGRDGKTDDLT